MYLKFTVKLHIESKFSFVNIYVLYAYRVCLCFNAIFGLFDSLEMQHFKK